MAKGLKLDEQSKRVIKKLYAKHTRVNAALARGLVKFGLLVQRDSQKIVPVDTGALRNSANTRKISGSGVKQTNPEVVVSYGTNYGIFVHENVNAQHASGKTHHFLTIALKNNKRKGKKIVADEIKRSLRKAKR